MGIIVFLILFFGSALTSVQAQTCNADSCVTELPDCQALGYVRASDAVCPEGHITCPFNVSGNTYVWCKTYTCADGGFVDESAVTAKRQSGYLCIKKRYHGLDCYDCSQINRDLCQYTEANRGNALLSYPCGDTVSFMKCTSNCTDLSIPPVGTVPDKSYCHSCGKRKLVVSGFHCKEGYTLSGDGSACNPTACPSGYSNASYPSASTIASQSANGYRIEKNGKSGENDCWRYVAKKCPDGYKTGITCPQSGYETHVSGKSGMQNCVYCESLNCPSPSSESYQGLSDCPTLSNSDWSVAKAWDYTSSTQNGVTCGTCQPKACNTGYSKNYQSVEDCGEGGYTFSYDKTRFYGDKYCGKCTPSTCPEGTSTSKVVANCFSGLTGALVRETDYYAADLPCKECVCQATKALCPYTSVQDSTDGKLYIGTNGTGQNVCCDGTSYENCTSSCGTRTECPAHANCSDCKACGDTYKVIESCKQGYTGATCDSCVDGYHKVGGECVNCESTPGYYTNPPKGAAYSYENTTKCYKVTGCASSWRTLSSDSLAYYVYSDSNSFKTIANATINCYKTTSCKNTPSTTYFQTELVDKYVAGEQNCYKAVACNEENDYYSASITPPGMSCTSTVSSGSVSCHQCENTTTCEQTTCSGYAFASNNMPANATGIDPVKCIATLRDCSPVYYGNALTCKNGYTFANGTCKAN